MLVLARLEIPALILAPASILVCAWLGLSQTAILTALVIAVCVVVLFAGFETSRPQLRQIMPTVVLAALAAAGRIIFALVPSVQPVSAIAIMAGVVFGRRSGFLVGACAVFVSNLFLGQGMWTPIQMYCFGLIGYLAGVLAEHRFFGDAESRQSKRAAVGMQKGSRQDLRAATGSQQGLRAAITMKSLRLYLFGFLAPFILYGFIVNLWYAVSFVQPISVASIVLACVAGISMDVAHGISTVVFLLVLYEPWKRKLSRIKTKYDLMLD